MQIGSHTEQRVAAVGTVASLGAVLAAAACCVLPLALAAAGVGATGLSVVTPFHWPLTILGMLAVSAGWYFYLRRHRARAGASACATTRPSHVTFRLLVVSSAALVISTFWRFIEPPLTMVLGG